MSRYQASAACAGKHGPWESDPCPVARRAVDRWFTNADAAVYVLETSACPLTIYDIQRGMQREFGWAPEKTSLNVTLANDLRCCWGGRGKYGLYRHGLLPGPRKLLDVGRFLLFVADEPLEVSALEFVMKRIGYRFHPMSLAHALAVGEGINWLGWTVCTVDQSSVGRERIRQSIPIGPRKADFDTVVNATRTRLFDALQERQERLDRARHDQIGALVD